MITETPGGRRGGPIDQYLLSRYWKYRMSYYSCKFSKTNVIRTKFS
eukprot:SAG31_NODE_13131_length_891_cov_0.680556_2_plen_45_part_01